jgi:hypothetical protein
VSRVLVMNLAYPQINDAVTELIMPGGPEVSDSLQETRTTHVK